MRWLALLLLAGCSGQPIIQTVEVQVPIAVPCLTETMLPARPDILLDPVLKGLDDYTMVLATWLERQALLDYSEKLEAVLKACQ